MKLLKTSLHFHKILGYILGILFLMWFISGMVMIFCRYPNISPKEKIVHGVSLSDQYDIPEFSSDKSGQSISIEDFGAGMVLNLNGFKYLLTDSVTDMGCVASKWGCPDLQPDTLRDMDVWLLGRMPANYQYPIIKYTYPGGENLYISQTTSEPIQYTTKRQRLGAWFGAVPHWLYITTLRRLGHDLWFWTIIVLSLAGVLMTLLGLTGGIVIAINSKRHTGRWSPYKNRVARWHHISGCLFGIFVLGWIFSGYMSMVELPQWIVKNPSPDRIPKLERVTPKEFTLPYNDIIRRYPDIRRLTLLEIGGNPVYKIESGDEQVRLLYASGPKSGEIFVVDEEVCRKIGGDGCDIELIKTYDSQYLSLRNELPIPVYRIKVPGPGDLTLYLNPTDASLRVSTANRAVRNFLYRGLHSLCFPFMTVWPGLRITVMLLFLLSGLFVVVTGLIQIKK